MKQFLKDMFSGSSAASFGRGATLLTTLTGCWALIHIVLHTHALPDPLTLAAHAAWMTSPYSINKVTALFSKDVPQPGAVPQLQASASPVKRRLTMFQHLVLIGIAILIGLAGYLAYSHFVLHQKVSAIVFNADSGITAGLADARSDLGTIDGGVIASLHDAEAAGKLAVGTVQTYVDKTLGAVETDAKAVEVDVTKVV